MPKFKSHVVREPIQSYGGGEALSGQTVLEPLNDAAKAMNITEEAIQFGVYKPASPTERQDIQRKLLKIEEEANKRRPKW
jgi:hypothetical protein